MYQCRNPNPPCSHNIHTDIQTYIHTGKQQVKWCSASSFQLWHQVVGGRLKVKIEALVGGKHENAEKNENSMPRAKRKQRTVFY
jgi:hypothetical protein